MREKQTTDHFALCNIVTTVGGKTLRDYLNAYIVSNGPFQFNVSKILQIALYWIPTSGDTVTIRNGASTLILTDAIAGSYVFSSAKIVDELTFLSAGTVTITLGLNADE